MRLRLSHLLTAGLLVCAGPARAAPPAGPEPEAKPPAPEIVLANHRAVYDLSLAEGDTPEAQLCTHVLTGEGPQAL